MAKKYAGDVEKPLPKESKKSKERDLRLLNSIVPALLMRAYHLPGYNWSQDLYQYLVNNHPVFGICFHNKLHPVGIKVRVISLIGSILFGLAITNIIYLAFVLNERNYEKSYITVQTNYTTQFVDENVATVDVTNGNIALWTIGAAFHGFYDNTIWSVGACTCLMGDAGISERMKKYESVGVYAAILAVVVTTAIATFAVMLRATLDANEDIDVTQVSSGGLSDDEVVLLAEVNGVEDFDFVVSYVVELALTYFLWYPLIGTILFTGVLGCGKIPVLGGRPYDIIVEEREKEALDA